MFAADRPGFRMLSYDAWLRIDLLSTRFNDTLFPQTGRVAVAGRSG